MKTVNRNPACKNNPTSKFGHFSLKRIRNVLRLNDTATRPASQLVATANLVEFSQTPENTMYQIENELKQTAGRVYANTTSVR